MDYLEKILDESLQGNGKSFAILEKAAKAGNAGAQYYLALYFKKKYGKVDNSRYLYWLEKSRCNGYHPIPRCLKILEQQQKPDWMPQQENRFVTHFLVLVFHVLFFMIKAMLTSSDKDNSVPIYNSVYDSNDYGIYHKEVVSGYSKEEVLKLLKDCPFPQEQTNKTITVE